MNAVERDKALDGALAQIEKQFGKGSVMRLGDASASYDVEAVSTGSLGLDIALGILDALTTLRFPAPIDVWLDNAARNVTAVLVVGTVPLRAQLHDLARHAVGHRGDERIGPAAVHGIDQQPGPPVAHVHRPPRLLA